MSGFFSHTVGIGIYERYGWFHFLLLFITFFTCYLIYKNRAKIRNWKYYDKFMRILFSSLFIGNLLVNNLIQIITNTWSYKIHLPLHICYIANLFLCYTLLTNNKKNSYKLTYFLSLVGPLTYLFFPDMATADGKSMLCGPDRSVFYLAFFSHNVLIIANFYCLFVYNWTIKKKNIFSTFVKINIIFGLVFIFNIIFKTNYIMTDGFPNFVYELIPILKHINTILILEFVGILVLTIAYLITLVTIKNDKFIKNTN